ncbi:MAG: YHS domain-containing protein [Verrucomicrobia bacterium]|nr:YHS domain-containing protein [Verrucomicrobiota bacterium]
MKKTLFTLVAALSLAGAALADHEPGHKVLVLKNRNGVAILGYDAVAYFTDNKPAQGSPKFSSEYEGANYHFASTEHKALFDANPAKYAPAYGGYCGYAASIDRLSPISPEWFQIIDGRLILQHNKKAYDKFNADLKGNLAKADQNWPGLLIRNGTGGKTLVNINRKGVALEGRDPVSYFTDGKPAKGDPKIEATYNGALYHFVSQEHRETFERSPAKYAPAFGGFCGYAASINKVKPVDVNLWSIVDDRLILQHSKKAVELWNKDVRGNLDMADRNWPGLVEHATAGTMANSKYPLTWPGFYDYTSLSRRLPPMGGGSMTAHNASLERTPMPSDLDWPGF